MYRVIKWLLYISAIVLSFNGHAKYIAELTLDIEGMYQGKLEVGLQDSQILKKMDDIELLLISQSYVQDNYFTLKYVVIEYNTSNPENRNELSLPTVSTLINQEAGVSSDGSFSYSVIVRKIN